MTIPKAPDYLRGFFYGICTDLSSPSLKKSGFITAFRGLIYLSLIPFRYRAFNASM
jgi:hypothetical protein